VRVRLDSIREPAVPQGDRPQPHREVEPRRTPLGAGEIRGALSAAYLRLHGRMIDPVLLDTLSAQVCHETGWGKSMHNFNFGGLKGFSPDGLVARCRTKEVLQGREVSIRDGFRAYASAVDGATDYLAFLETRHAGAIEAAGRGDVDGYVRALKQGHYFTASESAYASSLRGILRSGFDAVAPEAPSSRSARPSVGSLAPDFVSSLPYGVGLPPLGVDALPTSETVTRMLDALRLSASNIAAPARDDG
jgi:hypothetical protein